MADTQGTGGAQQSTAPPTVTQVEAPGENALEVRDAYERALTLGARDNPDGTRMPGGETVTEYGERQLAEHTEQGRAAEAAADASVRERSVAADPLYHAEAAVVAGEGGRSVILPPPAATDPAGTPEANGGQGDARAGASGQPPAATQAPWRGVTRGDSPADSSSTATEADTHGV